MKKIAMLLYYHSPLDIRVYYREALTLARAGYHVSIIYKEKYKGFLHDIAGNKVDNVENVSNIHFVPYSVHTGETNLINKLLSRFIAMFKMLKIIGNSDFDYVHIHESFPTNIPILFRRIGVKYVYDLHENHFEQYDRIGRAYSAPFKFLEKRILRKTRNIIAVGPRLLDHLDEYENAVENRVIIYNTRSIDDFVEYSPDNDVLVHEGNLTEDRGSRYIEEALDAVELNQMIGFLKVIGNRSSIERDYVRITGWVSPDRIASELAGSSVGINYPTTENSRFGVSIKFFGYLSASLPVVTIEGSEADDIVNKYQCGKIVKYKDSEDLLKTLKNMLENKEQLKLYSRNSKRAFIEEFNWEKQADKLLAFYERV